MKVGRMLDGLRVFCAMHLITRKAAAHSVPAAGMRAASTAFCARMSNLCPYPHRLPVLTDPGGKGELFSIPHTSIRLPAPTRPRNSAEKRNRCCPVFDSLDMRRRCDRSKIGETGWWWWGKGSACLVCREGAGGRSPSYQRKWQLDQCTVDQCCHQCSATDRCHHATSSSCSADPQQQQWLPQFRFWFQGSLLRDLCFG